MALVMQITISDTSVNPAIDDFDCEWFRLQEAISTPFRLEAVFLSENDYTGANFVGKTASFFVSQNKLGKSVGGVVLEFRVLNKQDVNSYTYAVVLGPRLSLLEKTSQSEVMGTTSPMAVRDVIEAVLSGTMNTGATISNRGVKIKYKILPSVDPDKFKRSNITKYNESDFNFFSRTCEQYGIFYIVEFKYKGDAVGEPSITDEIVVASDKSAFKTSSPSTWTFKARTTTVGASPEESIEEAANAGAVVYSLEHAIRPRLHQFNIRNYNASSPFSDLVNSPVDSGGIGGVVEYGEYFASTTEGTELATIRAQEMAWQNSTFECRSTIASLCVGQTFTLQSNPISSYNMEYLVVSARHEGGRRGPLGYSANYPMAMYHNEFVAIDASVDFRPRRVTPRPVMSGVYNAFIQATESTPGTPQQRAVLNEYGQYVVGFVYNEAANKSTPGDGSAYIRQVQPYAGSMTGDVVSGMHFPLVSNSEVLVGYVNGNPDQPIIMGAAFNNTNTDVVSSSTPTVNRIRSTGGLLLEMNDGTPGTGTSPPTPRYMRMDVPNALTDPPPAETVSTGNPSGYYLRFGTAASDASAGSQLKAYSSTVSQNSQGNKNDSTSDSMNEKASSSKTATTKSAVTQTNTTPSSDGMLIFSQSTLDMYVQGTGLMRFGNGHTTQTDQGDSVHTISNGQYTMTTLNGITMTAGKSGAPADVLIHAYNTVTTKSEGDTYNWIYGKQTKYTQGTSVTYFYGFAFTWNMALTMTTQLAGTMTMTIGIASTITLGMKADLIMGRKGDLVIGNTWKLLTGEEIKLETAKTKINALTNYISTGVENKYTSLKNWIATLRTQESGVSSDTNGVTTEQSGTQADTLGVSNTMTPLTNTM